MAINKLLIKTIQPKAEQVAYERDNELEVKLTDGKYDNDVEQYRKNREIAHSFSPQSVVEDGEYDIRNFEQLAGYLDTTRGVYIKHYVYKQ